MLRFFFLSLLLVLTATSHTFAKQYVLKTNHGTISSRNYPSPYPNNIDDTWMIKVKRGYRVVLYFTHFDLEDSFDKTPCSQDYVEILDDKFSNSSIRLCGNPTLYQDDAPVLVRQKFRSTSNFMMMKMKSDYSNDLPENTTPLAGFRAHFYQEDRNECDEMRARMKTAEEPENVGMCEHFCNNYPGGYYCTCRLGYKLHRDGYSCVGNCQNQVLTEPNGTIETTGYPGSYPRLTDCDWKILTEPGKRIEIQFDKNFHIEEYSPDTPDICPFDYIQIHDISGVRGKFCGTSPPFKGLATQSITNWFKIEFHSDKLLQFSGFKLMYKAKAIVCKLPNPPSHGTLSHITNAQTIAANTPENYIPFGGLIRFECEKDYRLFGSAKIACLKDGSLSENPPLCIPF